MAIFAEHPVLRFLRRITANEAAAAGSDAQLLTAFVRRRDEAAFAELVRRHGPMVFGVCTRVLGPTGDVEDAFQATFLVLTRKAASLRQPATLANWLYGVAYRTALRARTNAARRRSHERQVAAMNPAEGADELARRELRRVVDDELNRLPAKYRTAVVLCYLEGHTQEEVARQLGCPRATVATRLARACARLRGPLARRGLALPTAGLASLLAAEQATAAPAALAETTIQAAMQLAAGNAAATAASAGALTLTKEVLRIMFLTKLKTAVVLLLTAAALGAAVLGLTRSAPAGATPRPAPRAPAPVTAEDAQTRILKALQGDWTVVALEDNGRKASEDDMKGMHWKVKGSNVHPSDPGEKADERCTFRIDPEKDPGHFDLTSLKGQTLQGIYRLQGSWLTICLRGEKHPEKGRPMEFTAEEGSDQAMITVLKAQEPGKPNPLKGTWEVMEYVHKGERTPQKVIRQSLFKDGRLKFSATMMSHTDPRNGQGKSKPYRIAAGKDPGRIELLMGTEVVRGIYRLDGDTLRLCISTDPKKLPKDFPKEAVFGGGEFAETELLTLKRVKAP
jgi:RNA polymerase sigma factor (sigma-70 family)